MGDVQAWLALPNGEVGSYLTPPPSPSQASNPHPATIAAESWQQAEQATQEIIGRIQPTRVSEQRRRAVVEYVQKLIRRLLGTEVFPFGSVPLKTYLPDGDIDLTALAVPNYEDTLASDVCSALEVEEQNKDAEFEVKDVQYIHAEVKLVKCLVQNIVVDISFNQIGGLCTLCFLEQVDRLIGKNNLFKRSIILIKAWCYYESRILGAHHALISTYALETLVLYVFHLFHSSLDGPLAVLYRFLDYYSKFDWDNYCISLDGPISVSSLPKLVAEAPENDGGDLLLSKDFIRNCADMFSDPQSGLENNSRSFPQKHLNIVDPLKENNNLGRSVSKGNLYRIRSAFTYGARKLGRILILPVVSITDEVNMFFTNTMDRHGSGERSDVQDALSSCADSTVNHDAIDPVSSELKVEKVREDYMIFGKPTTDSHGALCEEIDNIKISGLDKEHETKMQLHKHPSNKHMDAALLSKCCKLESNGHVEGDVVSSRRLAGDAGDLASTRASGSRTTSKTCKAPLSSSDMIASPSRKAYHAPHLFFHPDNGIGNGFSPRDSSLNEENGLFIQTDSYENESFTSSTSCHSNHGIPTSGGSIDGSLTSRGSANRAECPQPVDCSLAENEGIDAYGSPMPNDLADLSGDYEIHFNGLLYARDCREYMLGDISKKEYMLRTVYYPVHQSYNNKYSWDAARRHNIYTHINANGVVSGPPFSPPGCYPINPPPFAYGMEEMRKPRGTGTYFPNARAYKERQSPGRGRNPAPASQLTRPRNNGRAEIVQDTSIREKGSQDPPLHAQFPMSSGIDRGKPVQPDIHNPPCTASKSFSHANSFLFPSVGKLEFGSLGPAPLGASMLEVGKKLDAVSAHSQGSGPAISASTMQRSMTRSNTERPRQSYQLKNDDDFPPLAG